MLHSTSVTTASVAVGALTALIWFKAPLLPAIVGAIGAGALLYLRSRHA